MKKHTKLNRVFLTLLAMSATSLWCLPATERSYDVIEKLSDQAFVNWTNGWIYSKVTVAMMRAESTSLTESRLRAVKEAKERAKSELSRAVLLLAVDSTGSLGEQLSRNPKLRQDFELLETQIKLIEHTTGEGTVTIRMGLPLFGRTGLLQRLPPATLTHFDQALQLPVQNERYTGLVIYVELAKDYRPSLRPALSLRTGERFLVIENLTSNRGYYYLTEDAARDFGKVADRPLVLYAAASVDGTDLLLDEADAERILANSGLLQAVRQGSVAIIVSPAN